MSRNRRLFFIRTLPVAVSLMTVSPPLLGDSVSEPGPSFVLLAPYLIYGPSGPSDAMGDAQSALPNGLLSLSGNPAHAGLMARFETSVSGRITSDPLTRFSFQTGHPIPKLGFVAAGVHYFRMNLKNWDNWFNHPMYNDWTFSVTVGRNFGSWMALGVTLKAVSSEYFGTPIHGYFWDAGLLLMKKDLSKTTRPGKGLILGASLTNKEAVPIRNIPGSGRHYGTFLDAPTAFRIGASLIPAVSDVRRFTLAVEAVVFDFDYNSWDDYYSWNYLRTSAVNVGFEYRAPISRSYHIQFRGGLRAAFLREERVPTFGLGFARSLAGGAVLESGYSCMDERSAPARLGIYLRFKQ